MRRKSISLFISFFAVSFFLFGTHSVNAQEADPFVDEQENAVATNLGLFGIEPWDMIVDPTNSQYVYAASYTPNGIFHSSDGGVTWSGFPADANYGAGKDVEVDAQTGDLYALISDSLLKSTDHGETWIDLSDAIEADVYAEALLVANGRIFVALQGGGVAVSADGGETFALATLQSGTGTYSSVISFSAASGAMFYAVFEDEQSSTYTLWKTLDGGTTWMNMLVTDNGVQAGDRFYDIAVDPQNTSHLVLASYDPDSVSYHSLDAGITWTALMNGNQRIGSSEAEFDGAGRLYIGRFYTEDPISVSPTWTMIGTTTPLSSVPADIYATDPSDPDTLFTNSGMGIAKSTDGAATWIDVNEGLTALQTYAISQAEEKDIVWIGATGGLARTTNFTDEEPEWTYPILPASGVSDIEAVWVHPTEPDIVVAGLSTFLSKSVDGGETWVQATAPQFFGQVKQIVASPQSPEVLYAVYLQGNPGGNDSGGVFKSTDAGSTWTDLAITDNIPANALAVGVADGQDVLYVGSGDLANTGVYLFNGSAWSKLEEDFNSFKTNSILVHPDDNNVVFVTVEGDSTQGSLYRSEDAGQTWTAITTGLENANHLDAIVVQVTNTSNLYMSGQDSESGDGVIYKSSDDGESWSIYYRGLKQEFFYTLLFDGLLTGNDRGLFSLKSFGEITLKVKHLKKVKKYRLTMTLLDAATDDPLAERKMVVYKKKGKKWKSIAKVRTNEKGKVQLLVAQKRIKKRKIQVVWRPAKADQSEYTTTRSDVVKVK